jgi:hypothetical protein
VFLTDKPADFVSGGFINRPNGIMGTNVRRVVRRAEFRGSGFVERVRHLFLLGRAEEPCAGDVFCSDSYNMLDITRSMKGRKDTFAIPTSAFRIDLIVQFLVRFGGPFKAGRQFAFFYFIVMVDKFSAFVKSVLEIRWRRELMGMPS